ncbi:hypothetical protein P3T18_003102 [Paraburkholderia sp. GAS199]|uniref:UvrD-helicase domain-containing protein n=1 Tax=Paraburkholderia sp. GAS199 TaxID=3035126 RepID=UPI003D1BB76B
MLPLTEWQGQRVRQTVNSLAASSRQFLSGVKLKKVWNWLIELYRWVCSLTQKNLPQPGATATAAPAVPKPPKPLALYEGRELDFDSAKVASALELMRRTDPKSGETTGPSEAQEQLIFAKERGVSVLAGAGSGKSTSLVSRLLFMRHQLDIPYPQISVFTFTRKSREDFIEKLVTESSHWPNPVAPDLAEKIVRTFHSKALAMARGAMDPNTRIFEFLGAPLPTRKGSTASDEVADLKSTVEPRPDELSEAEMEANRLPDVFPSDLRLEQVRFLDAVYRRCFASSQEFRDTVKALLRESVRPMTPRNPADPAVEAAKKEIEWHAKHDQLLFELTTTHWTKHGQWPIEGVRELDDNGKPFMLEAFGTHFRAHGYVRQLNAYIVLGVENGVRNTPLKLKPSYKGVWASVIERTKVAVLLAYCDKPVIYVRNDYQLQNLSLLLRYEAGTQSTEAPKFNIVPPGDYADAPIDIALYKTGIFAENLALDPRKLLNRTLLPAGSAEYQFAAATAAFYEELYRTFEAEQVESFNRIFSKLASEAEWWPKVTGGTALTMKHLLIDEFQDISPLIVRFVAAMHKRLQTVSKGFDAPTLMCVGDDWQSIYGWRGSSPQFFLRFAQYFPGARKAAYRLRENYRSSAAIISAAESALSDLVEQFPDKQGGIAMGKLRGLNRPVALVAEFVTDDAVELVRTLLERLPSGERVFVLTRTKTNPTFTAIKNAFRHESNDRLVATTFHQSKGLEAEYVVLVGDIQYSNAHVLRNALYRMARMGNGRSETPYDDAQRDEARRLAYVGITRAKKVCIWLCKPQDGGTFNRLPSNAGFSRSMKLGEVQDMLDELLADKTRSA